MKTSWSVRLRFPHFAPHSAISAIASVGWWATGTSSSARAGSGSRLRPHSGEQDPPGCAALVGRRSERERLPLNLPRIDTFRGAYRYRPDRQAASGHGHGRREIRLGAAARRPGREGQKLSAASDLQQPDTRAHHSGHGRDMAVPAPHHAWRHRGRRRRGLPTEKSRSHDDHQRARYEGTLIASASPPADAYLARRRASEPTPYRYLQATS